MRSATLPTRSGPASLTDRVYLHYSTERGRIVVYSRGRAPGARGLCRMEVVSIFR